MTTDVTTDTPLAAARDDCHGVRMAWPVCDCRLTDGYLVTSGRPGGWYNPFRLYTPLGSSQYQYGYHSLYARLARSADSSDEELASFCSRYGLPDWPDVKDHAEGVWCAPQLREEVWADGGEVWVFYPVARLRSLARLLALAMRVRTLPKDAHDDFALGHSEIDELGALHRELTTTDRWIWGESPPRARLLRSRGHDCPSNSIALYWLGPHTDDLRSLARRWNLRWDSANVADLKKEHKPSPSESEDPQWREHYRAWLERYPAIERTHIPASERANIALVRLHSLGDPQGRSHPSLKAALVAMLLRDDAGGKRCVICEVCGRPFYTRHARQRYCPPDPAGGNPGGCAKLRADRQAQRRRRHRQREASAQTRRRRS